MLVGSKWLPSIHGQSTLEAERSLLSGLLPASSDGDTTLFNNFTIALLVTYLAVAQRQIGRGRKGVVDEATRQSINSQVIDIVLCKHLVNDVEPRLSIPR